MDKLINTITNTELLLVSLSKKEWLQWAKKHSGQNIFFGIGLMTHNEMSEDVPFDILGIFFLAELLRRITNGAKVFLLVADQHATTNQLIAPEKIEEKTKKILLTFQSIVNVFDLTHFQLIQTTQLNCNEDIKKIFKELPDMDNGYLKHEVADTVWLNKFHNVGVKLGWAMSSQQVVEGHDERFFDSEIAKFCSSVDFIHAKPGRTADVKRQRVSPYISIRGEKRIRITNGEDALEKIKEWKQEKNNVAIKPLFRHLSQILRLHDMLFSPVMFSSFEEKIQKLIDKITKD